MNIIVVDANSQSGRGILQCLAERSYPKHQVFALDRELNPQALAYGDDTITTTSFECFDFKQANLVIFTTPTDNYEAEIQSVIVQGCAVIDGPNFYRKDKNVPMIIPEINGNILAQNVLKNIMCGANCAAIQMAMALYPLHKVFRLTKVVATALLSASGKGFNARKELIDASLANIKNENFDVIAFPQNLAFDVIPQSDDFVDTLNTKGELDIAHDIQKIFESEIDVSLTSVRVPVDVGHGISIHAEFENKPRIEKALEILAKAEGISVETNGTQYNTPKEIAGQNDVFVSRIRQNLHMPNTLDMWVVADNLRKGTALNVVQTALMYKNLKRL